MQAVRVINEPLLRAGEILKAADYVNLEQRVARQGETLLLMHEALVEIASELSRIRRGDLPPGAVARY